MTLALLMCLTWGWSTPQESWQQGNAAYQQEQWAAAIDHYEAILAEGQSNGKLHYNLGNAYFKDGRLGKAVLHYYRAQKFLPGDADVQNNLDIANQNREDPIIENEDEAFLSHINFVWHRIPYSVVFWSCLMALVIAGFASLLIIAKPDIGKWAGYLLVVSALLGLLLMGTAFLQHRQLVREDFAVILAEKVPVLAGPQARETVNFTIHEGIRCLILDETPGWYRIRLANGYNGWVPQSSLERI
ncbi:tetratricopeptide repeat protein [Acanthopleuribacter pedis]|uniref:Tetratricopeptide repeat protein n=1 Tax=Acanthopleuribacter pedis TaxID=442870 RepID=A0A8J7QLG2_9BACT|nr:tetratricopeptide repeat protein [Acanthopleuribacter pedis]MBO1323306.1 tetratricopeptide repeat protein [Acanthopleuribacter pedis]